MFQQVGGVNGAFLNFSDSSGIFPQKALRELQEMMEN